ncbi:hypothetical protein KQUDLBSD_CDS0143 [Staphylococcus phage PG-2021_40]
MSIQLIIALTLAWVNLGYFIATIVADISNDRKLYEQTGNRLGSWHYLNAFLRMVVSLVGIVVGYLITNIFNLDYSLVGFIITLLSIFYITLLFKVTYMFLVSLVVASRNKNTKSNTTSIDIDNM